MSFYFWVTRKRYSGAILRTVATKTRLAVDMRLIAEDLRGAYGRRGEDRNGAG